MNKQLLYIIISILLFQTIILAENPCNIMSPRGGDNDWGDGVIYISDSLVISVFSDTLSTHFGVLKKENNHLNLRDGVGTIKEIAWGDIEYIRGYDAPLLKVKTKSKSEYYKVFWKTDSKGFFIKKRDIEQLNIPFYTYADLLLSEDIHPKILKYKSWANIGVNLNKNCLNLRETPTSNSSVIYCIPSNDWNDMKHTHLKILEVQGQWTQVIVTNYQYDPVKDDSGEGCGFTQKSQHTGWLKAIGDDGFPNIWFSVSSY